MKDLIKYLLIGITQGISEVLPISSSAHLVLLQLILGVSNDNLTLEVFLHLASLCAVLYFMRHRLKKLIVGFLKYIIYRKKEDLIEFRYFWYLILSTIPVAIFTIIFKKYINIVSNNIMIISLLLITNGLLLILVTKINGLCTTREITYKDAFIIGCFECLGVFPGISRSGSCICGGYVRKIDKDVIADYAFLLFIPAVLGATILEFDNFWDIMRNNNIIIYLVTFIATAVVTYYSFKWFLRVIKKGQIKYFGYYCIIIGAISCILSCIL